LRHEKKHPLCPVHLLIVVEKNDRRVARFVVRRRRSNT